MIKAFTPSFNLPWGTLLKISVSGSLIVWLLSKLDLERVWEVVQSIHGGVLVLVLGLMWLTLFAIAKRWQLIVQLCDISPPFVKLSEATFIGAFFNQFLPSSVGGDFFRILAVRQQGSTLNEAVTGVFMDRLFGFISLGILCVIVVPMEGEAILSSDLKWPFLLTLLLLLGVLVGGVALLILPKSWHPFFFVRPFIPLIGMVRKLISHPMHSFFILLSSMAASIFLISGLQILMMAFDIPLTWGQGAVILPVVLMITSLPISFAGWGLREGAMIIALGVYGVSQETAIALSLVYGILHLVSAVPGLVLWIMKKKHLNLPASAY